MSEKALAMLKHMRSQIFGQPAPYVEVRGAAISVGVDPGGGECAGLVEELLRAGYIQHYRAWALPTYRFGRVRGRGRGAGGGET